VNVAAGIIGLYSLSVAAQTPVTRTTPYGHGKAEFISAAVEGTLITVAGFLIVYEAVKGIIFPGLSSNLTPESSSFPLLQLSILW
jgi:divalent metal cation (Fe/Co/Zn/Cd) transporter